MIFRCNFLHFFIKTTISLIGISSNSLFNGRNEFYGLSDLPLLFYLTIQAYL